MQELWDKPANQLNAQSSQATNLGHQTPTQDSSNRFYQELNSLASGQNRVSETQSSQIPQYNGQVSNRTQIPTSNGNLGGLSQAYGSRFFQGNTNNFNQNGQANPINGLGLSNNGLGAQNGVQNNYGGQAGIQATQAYLQVRFSYISSTHHPKSLQHSTVHHNPEIKVSSLSHVE